MKVEFHKAINPNVVTDPPAFFKTDPVPSFQKYGENVWKFLKEQLEQQIENYVANGSGWVVSRIIFLEISFVAMDPPGTAKTVEEKEFAQQKKNDRDQNADLETYVDGYGEDENGND